MGFVANGNIGALSVQNGMTYGGIQNQWDALKEDFDSVAYLPFGDEYWDAMNHIMNAIGNREIAKQPLVRWFEMNRMEVPFQVLTGGSIVAAGRAVTLDPTGPYVTEVNGTQYSWPANRDIYRHALTGQLFQVQNKTTALAFDLVPLDSTATGTIAIGDYFFYVGVTVPENSTRQASKYVFDTLYTSFLQTMRHDSTSSSEALYNQLWYSQLENGVATPYSNSRDVIYLQREHQVSIVNTFLAGTTSNNATNLESFQTTAGLIPTINSQGQTIDSAGGITVDLFYDMEAALTTQDASIKNYMVWTTGQTSREIEEALGGGSTTTNYFANQNVQINKAEMQKTFWGEGAYADLMSRTYSFNNLVVNNKNFGLVRMGVFDNPQMFGAGLDETDNVWKSYAVFLPLSSQGIDDGLGNMGKYIRMCHKPGAFMNMWQTGGRAAANKTETWELGIHIVSEIGYKFINANKYGLMGVGVGL
jgi:hypothetical protein